MILVSTNYVTTGSDAYPVHLVWNVSQHDRGTDITAIQDTLAADTVVLIMRMVIHAGLVGIGSLTVINQATLTVDARLGTVG